MRCALAFAVVAVLAVVLLGGCGGDEVRGRFSSCPPQVRAGAGDARAARREGTLTIPAPVAARVCVYEDANEDGHERLERTLVLRRFVASRLVARLRGVVSNRPSGGSDCVPDPLVFRLRTTGADVVTVTAAGCELSRGSDVAVLTQGAGEQLSSLGGDRIDPPYHSTPDVMGGRLDHAIRVQRRRHWKVHAEAEEMDSSVPFGTIVWQSPLPGALQDLDISEIAAVVAVRAAPPCRGDQLRGEYQENSPTTGNGRNGAIGLRSISRQPCSLGGVVRVVGRNRHKRPVTDSFTFRARVPIVLSRTRRGVPSLNAGTSAFEGSTQGNVSLPHGVTCDHLVEPATWFLTFGDHQHVSLANRDPHSALNENAAFYSCRGNVGAVDKDLVFFQG